MHSYKHLFINDKKVELRVYNNFESFTYIGYDDDESCATMGIFDGGLSTNSIAQIDGVDVI